MLAVTGITAILIVIRMLKPHVQNHQSKLISIWTKIQFLKSFSPHKLYFYETCAQFHLTASLQQHDWLHVLQFGCSRAVCWNVEILYSATETVSSFLISIRLWWQLIHVTLKPLHSIYHSALRSITVISIILVILSCMLRLDGLHSL